MESLKCRSCKKELTDDMEIEFSWHLTEFFCGPDCATDHFFEYMRSSPLDWADKQFFKDKNAKVVKGKLKRAD